ncbi:SH3-like domain-containing protein, partial [Lactobacillus nasalidis]
FASRPAAVKAATVSKMPGTKTMGIYSRISSRGASKRLTTTKYFVHSKIQSTASRQTKQGIYDYIYANGRPLGWVNEKWFIRNRISAAKQVCLVSDDNRFSYKDAINYVTDSRGNLIDPSSSAVKASLNGQKLTFTYGKAKKTVQLVKTANPNRNLHLAISAKKGPAEVASSKNHAGSSPNWNAAHRWGVESSSNSWTSGGLTLTTRLWEPRSLSLAGNGWQQVGPVMEGLTVNSGWAYSSWYRSAAASDQLKGNLVAFNLNRLNKYQAQYLANSSYLYNKLSLKTFAAYSQNVKVSPYIRLGHGQSLGSSKNYIYVLANQNRLPGGKSNGFYSEEILQLNKSDLTINKLWTIRVDVGTSGRYFHNAAFAGDDTMYGLFHNAGFGRYEYWCLKLVGNRWQVSQVKATASNFVKQQAGSSPVQGFSVGSGHMYLAFNNLIFKLKSDGTYEKTWKHVSNRETEGLSADGSQLYVQLAQRGEILSGRW